MNEIKSIDGYENYYISENGEIFSNGNKLKQYENNGHLFVYLYKDTKRKKFYVHRLVAEAFLPNPCKYPVVNHKDENPRNNNVLNLEWCSHKYNTNYGTCIKRRANSCKKRILQIDSNGNIVCAFKGVIEAANYLKIDASSISKVALGKRKTAGGFFWKYEC